MRCHYFINKRRTVVISVAAVVTTCIGFKVISHSRPLNR
jgi:hypothetical protein